MFIVQFIYLICCEQSVVVAGPALLASLLKHASVDKKYKPKIQLRWIEKKLF